METGITIAIIIVLGVLGYLIYVAKEHYNEGIRLGNLMKDKYAKCDKCGALEISDHEGGKFYCKLHKPQKK